MSSNNANRRASRGRQRIPLARIENDTHRNVTFSKRRSGLIKKASEISTLCGVEILLVIFSPSGKAYTFSNPSMDEILRKYFGDNPTAQTNLDEQVLRDHREAIMQLMSFQITMLEMQIEDQIKINQDLREDEKVRPSISDLPLSELLSMKYRMEMLRSQVLQMVMHVREQARKAQFDRGSIFGNSQFGADDVVGPSGAGAL